MCNLLLKAVTKTATGAWNCTAFIYKKCKATRKLEERPVSLSQTTILEVNVIEWQIEKCGSRLILYAVMPDGNLYFNHLTGCTEDAYGRELRGLNVKPTPGEELMRYLQVLDNMSPPKLEKGAPNNHEFMAEDPDILYDGLKRNFYHADTGKVVSGFKLPPE
jgi:hypothetical protein